MNKACLISAWIGLSSVLCGMEPVSAAAENELERVMLLSSDDVVHGVILETPAGFQLRRRGGMVTYPTSQVLHVGRDLAEIYEFKKTRFPDHDQFEHAKLAQWCLEKGMKTEAILELERVVEIDPSNQRAIERLRLLKRPAATVMQPARSSDSTKSMPVVFDAGAYVNTFRAGYGTDMVDQFSTQLDPILLNKCIVCHANNKYSGKFQLFKRETGPQDRKMRARNLQSVVRAIDNNDPGQSPILYYAINRHGHGQVPPLGGPNDPLYQALRDWVWKVADAHNRDVTNTAEGWAGTNSGRRANDAAVNVGRFDRPVRPVATPGDLPPGRSGFTPLADDSPEPRRETMVPQRAPTASQPPDDARNVAPVLSPTQPEYRRSGQQIVDPYDPSAFNAGQSPPADASLPKNGAADSVVTDQQPLMQQSSSTRKAATEQFGSGRQDAQATLTDDQTLSDQRLGEQEARSKVSDIENKAMGPLRRLSKSIFSRQR